MANLSGWHLLIILAIVLLLFGAPRLPALARSLGQSMKIFKTEIKDPEAEKAKADAAAAANAQAYPPANGQAYPPAQAPTTADPSHTAPGNPSDPTTKP